MGEKNSPAPQFEACPPNIQGRVGTAREVSLTCLLAGNMMLDGDTFSQVDSPKIYFFGLFLLSVKDS